MGAILEVGGGMSETDADARYVNVTGTESMAGPLTITGDLYADEVIAATRHPWFSWRNGGSSTTNVAVGTAAPTAAGTATAIASTSGTLTNYATAATAGQAGGVYGTGPSNGIMAEWLPDARFVVQDVAEANFRIFVGYTADTSLNKSTISNYIAGFRLDSVAAETNWTIWFDNAAASAEQIIDTGVAATGDVVTLRIQWTSATTIKFYIDGVLVHTASADTPQPATAAMIPWAVKYTTENVAKNFRFRSMRTDLMGLVY